MNYRSLFGKLEATLDRIEKTDELLDTLSAILSHLVDDFRDDLGLVSGRVYARRDDAYVLQAEYPAPDQDHCGFEIPTTYEPIQELHRRGFVFHELGDPELDQRLEAAIGVRTFAAIVVGEAREQLIAFSLRDSSDRDQVVFTLNTIRHVINLKLRKQRLEDRVAQVREIQRSLLPVAAPRFEGYDIYGASVPAEDVGGDLYDFIRLSKRSMAVAIADSAGHGLPAALQARDAIIGLRMGVEEHLRITATVEKLNRVVSRSAMASRFISLFYCEVEPNGNLIYCNAGHNPPLLWRAGEFFELRSGGMVLGPNPEAQYERGYMLMPPGSVLLAYTDGITEAEDPSGEMFGAERLMQILREQEWESARSLVDTVFHRVRRFSTENPPVDDQTVVAVIRTHH